MPDGRVLEYIVDASNRRIAKKVDGVLTKGFLYEGSLRIAAELDANGSVVSRFVYATGVNVPEYMSKGGATYRIVTDHLGSVRMVVDVNTGAVAQELQYDEFGVVELDTNPGFTPFGFAGGLYDQDTKLVRFGARDYDAETGRWTAKDPIGFNGGDTNLYGYVLGDPVNFVDFKGLWGFGAIGSASAEVGLIIIGAGATGSVGVGGFIGGEQGINSGAFASGGAFAGGPGYGPGYPDGDSGHFAAGAFAGAGGGVFITNANCAKQLSGPFDTYSFNIGFGPQVSLQIGVSSDGTWIVSGTGGPIGYGINVSSYPTNTGTTP